MEVLNGADTNTDTVANVALLWVNAQADAHSGTLPIPLVSTIKFGKPEISTGHPLQLLRADSSRRFTPSGVFLH